MDEKSCDTCIHYEEYISQEPCASCRPGIQYLHFERVIDPKDARIAELESELARLRDERRWRKMDEKPPSRGWYPTWKHTKHDDCQESAFFNGGYWEEHVDGEEIYLWTMPLPEPPEAE